MFDNVTSVSLNSLHERSSFNALYRMIVSPSSDARTQQTESVYATNVIG